MPLTVRKFNAQVKDPNTGDMVPAGLLSSDALGAIEEAKNDAVGAIESKQAVSEAAIELKGATTLASIPADYTEMGEEISALQNVLQDGAVTESFISGNRAVANPGTVITNNQRCTSKSAIHMENGDVLNIIGNTSQYKYGYIIQYEGQSPIGTSYWITDENYTIVPTGECDIYINVANSSETSISPSDIPFTVSHLLGTFLPVKNKIGITSLNNDITSLKNTLDQNNVSSLSISQGYWAIADGGSVSSGDWCKSDNYVSNDFVLKTTTLLYMFLLAYEDDVYVGTWNGSEFTKTYDNTSYFTTIDLTEWSYNYPTYQFKIDFRYNLPITPAYCQSNLTIIKHADNELARIDEINRYLQTGGWDSSTGKEGTNNNWYGFTNYIDDNVHSIINKLQSDSMTLRFILLAYNKNDEYIGAWDENTRTFVKSSPTITMLLYTAYVSTLKKLYPAYKFKVTMVSADAMSLDDVSGMFLAIREYDYAKTLLNHNLIIENGYWAVADGEAASLNYEWCRTTFNVPLNCIVTYDPGTMMLQAFESDGTYVGTWNKSTNIFSKTYSYADMILSTVNMFEFARQFPDYVFMLSFRIDSGTVTAFLPVERVNNNLHVDYSGDDTLVLPDYYVAYMANKNQTIMDNIKAVGRFGETFVFITDLHWESNYKKSPMLIENVLKNTNAHILICGGDLVSRDTKATVENSMYECIKAFDIPTHPMHTAFGNHDTNAINWSTPQEISANSLDANEVFGLSQKNSSYANIYITENGINYYFDRIDTKTRFIVLDTGIQSTYAEGTVPALCDILNATPEGYKIVIVQHWYFNGVSAETAAITTTTEMLMDIVKQYNIKGSYIYDGMTYSFANAVSEIVLMLGGHTHYDYVLAIDDERNTAGVPIICTMDDSTRDRNAVKGTTSEQCFDVITIDYTEREINCIRIGEGLDRIGIQY